MERSEVNGRVGVEARLDVTELFRAQWRPMLRLAVLLIDDPGAAEDVVQDAFVALQRNHRAPSDPSAAVAYLRTTVVNRCRSALRHRYVVSRFLRESPPPTALPDPTAAADDDAEMLAALARLPRRQREVLILRYWTDLPMADVAATLGISLGSVKAASSRGLAALRTSLEQS